jgi:DNA repair exonuclease SbcCD ATPase subunit
MIKFTRVFYKNFLSSGSGGTEIFLDKTSSSLLVGRNGSGKSSMIDAICFALFNKSFRNLSKPKIVNSKNKKQCLCEVNFEIGTKQYLVKRGIKPDIFEIWIDNEMVDQSAKKFDYQEYLEQQILQLNYKSFTQIVILGSRAYTPFMELKTGPRREVIEDLLDLTIFSKMNLVLKERIKSLTDSVQKLDTKIDSLYNTKSLKEKYVQQAEKQNQSIEESIISNIDTTNTKLSQVEQNLEKNKQEFERLLSELVTDSRPLEKKLNKFVEIRGGILSNKTNHTKIVQFYSKYDSCPTCNQEIDEEFKSGLILDSTSKLESYEAGLVDLNAKIDLHQKQVREINNNAAILTNLQSTIRNFEHHKETLLYQLKQYEKQLTDAQNRNTIDTNTEKNEIAQLLSQIEEYTAEKDSLEYSKKYLNMSGKLLKDDGIKTMIISQYLPVINKLINHYLTVMDFFVSFNFDENFDEIIKSRHRDNFSYANLSEGEKMRVNLSILFTFRKIASLKNTCNTNLLILDEIADSVLDSDGIEILTQILKEFEDNNVFMISHKDEMMDKFDRTLKFFKQNDYSIMEEIG